MYMEKIKKKKRAHRNIFIVKPPGKTSCIGSKVGTHGCNLRHKPFIKPRVSTINQQFPFCVQNWW